MSDIYTIEAQKAIGKTWRKKKTGRLYTVTGAEGGCVLLNPITKGGRPSKKWSPYFLQEFEQVEA